MRNTSKIKDLTGKKFNKLTVIRIASRDPLYWECKCDCGNTTLVRTSNLTRGMVKSCGCLQKRGNPTHHLSNTRLYRIYKKMIRRCYVENEPAYVNYGGRGISVCNEWRESVEEFYKWAVENGYQENLTIDRIDNDGDYCPSNCRWTTYERQSNNRRTNIDITIDGVTRTLQEWCTIYDMPYKRVHMRIRAGWNPIDAITYKQDARLFPRQQKGQGENVK